MADYIIDAKNKRLGRISTEIALILQGKKNPDYEPNKIGSDRALVKNADKVTLSGEKAKTKVYYRHTGYMGHLKEKKYSAQFEKNPEKVLRETVLHMLPKNFLAKRRIKNLVFIKDENGK